MLRHAISVMETDYLATGHYARLALCNTAEIPSTDERMGTLEEQVQPQHLKLLRGVDETKDQSYFLSAVELRFCVVGCGGGLAPFFCSPFPLFFVADFTTCFQCLFSVLDTLVVGTWFCFAASFISIG